MEEWQEWRKIKNAANIFGNAANILKNYTSHGISNNIEIEKSLAIPEIVLKIFSCELGLKSLLSKNGITYDKIHELTDLFKLLPIQIQENIRTSTKSIYNNDFQEECDFDSELLKISKMFIEIRYYFEGEQREIIVGFIDIFNFCILHSIGSYE